MKRLLLVFALLFAFSTASGQSLTSDLNGRFEYWPSDDQCYQNQIQANSSVTASMGAFTARGFLQFTWWGACDAKIKGSFLNAEAGKVIERSHGIELLYWIGDVGLGATIQRDAVHHIWRNSPDWRHNQFPHDNSWKGAEKRCLSPIESKPYNQWANGTCPGIGYWDGVGPTVVLDLESLRIELDAPIYHWKDLTLPSPILVWSFSFFKKQRFYLEGRGEVNSANSAVNDFEVGYDISNTVSIGVSAGTVGVPGWRDDLRRVAIVLRAD